MMITRLILDPQRFRNSFIHHPESFFFASFWLSIATLIGNIQLYGITMGGTHRLWLITTVRVLYWIYAGASLVNVIQQYWMFIQRTPQSPAAVMNPSWFLPGYSAMLTGTIASIIAQTQPPSSRMGIIVSGCAYQGLGWLISMCFIVIYIIHLMENGLPPPALRPGMFIPVGSASFTVVALIGQARAIPRDYGYFASHPSATDTLQTMALFIGIFLWIFSFWLFSIAVLGVVTATPEMGFSLSWWAFVFPNVGFTIATIELGIELESEGIMWVGSAMSVGIVGIWLLCAVACVRAVVTKRIMWPGKDEDKGM
jgi:tellurite resistance protein TehA-like permease